MNRNQAYQILTEYIKNPSLIKHHLAAEATMKGLAEYLYNNKKLPNDEIKGRSCAELAEAWGIVGLLHDADYEETKLEPQKHTKVLEEKIGSKLKPEILHAIKAHAYGYNDNGAEPKSQMDWAIFTCDELTGLIIATALVKPDRKLASVDVKSVLKRMREPSFARSVNREQIKLCEEKLNIPLEKFIEIVLQSMRGIARELGL